MDMAKRHVNKSSKDAPIQSRDGQGQARAHMAVKTGGFSIGAFAASNRGNLEDFYEVERKVLGEGSYGSVQKCVQKGTGQKCAVKTINTTLVKNREQFTEEMA